MRSGIRLRWIKRQRIEKGGRTYVYVRVHPPGRKPVRLPDLPENDPLFLAAYLAAIEGAERRPTAPAGSLGELVTAYLASPEWADLAEGTRRSRRPRLDAIRAKAGAAPRRGLRPEHIRQDVSGLSTHASNHRLKAWKALLAWAVETGMIPTNPAEGLRLKRPRRTEGHKLWTREEIARTRAALPPSTKARLLLELALWTGARRSDLVHLGLQNVGADGWLRYRQRKTDQLVEIPFTAAFQELAEDQTHLLAALDACQPTMLFLETSYGRPHSANGLGNWFQKHIATPAGLVERSLHGLRKRRATDLAELGWSSRRIAAWLGHETISEGETYTRHADRRRLLAGADS